MVKFRHMANTFRKVYKKTGNNGNESDYQLIANVGVNGVDLDLMKGATTEADGELGLVPKPVSGKSNRYLSSDGTWKTISYNNAPKTVINIPAATHTKINSLTIEEPGLYIIFFRARVSGIRGANVGNQLNLCLIQTRLTSENNNQVGYLATRAHFVEQDDSFNEYDIVRITESTTVNMTIYHNAVNYTMKCEYSSISAVLLEE